MKHAALRKAIAEGNADIKAGRTRPYQNGQIAERAKRRLAKKG